MSESESEDYYRQLERCLLDELKKLQGFQNVNNAGKLLELEDMLSISDLYFAAFTAGFQSLAIRIRDLLIVLTSEERANLIIDNKIRTEKHMLELLSNISDSENSDSDKKL